QIDRLGIQQRLADRNDDETTPAHARALLIPERQLARDRSVLIDARLDLQGTIDQLRFRKVIDHRLTVVRAIAAAADPSDEIVAVSRSERQDVDEFRRLLPGQRHEHVIRLHVLRALLLKTDLRRNLPEVLAVVEDRKSV